MSNKLQATFHPDEPPHTTGTMIDAITYPLDDDDINVTERARPIINAMLAAAKAEALREAADWLFSIKEQNTLRGYFRTEARRGIAHGLRVRATTIENEKP